MATPPYAVATGTHSTQWPLREQSPGKLEVQELLIELFQLMVNLFGGPGLTGVLCSGRLCGVKRATVAIATVAEA